MVDLDKAIIARYQSHGSTFEVLIDKEVAKLLREEKEVDLYEHMVIDEIFSDSKKGDRAKDGDMMKVFGTTEVSIIAKKIILDGEVQLTTEERRKMLEEKTLRIIGIIARNAVNPQTKTPHPPSRIENAMNEAKVHVNPMKTAEGQVQAVVSKIRRLIPISFEKVRLAIRLSGEDYGRCYGDVTANAVVMKEEWQLQAT